MPPDDSEERLARAEMLRRQIARLKAGETPEGVQPGSPESGRDFVQRRMEEVADEGEAPPEKPDQKP